jgi:hypothetical protein
MNQSVQGKFLVSSEQEFIKLFDGVSDVEDVERFIGAEFPYADGTYASDLDDMELTDEELDEIESQDIDRTQYRKNDDWAGPEQYPAVCLIHYADDFDRIGNVRFRLLECVYLSDFKAEK